MYRRNAVLACAVTLLAGRSALALPPVPEKARFLLLLNEDASYRASSGGGSADRIAEYTAWATRLAESGSLAAGEKLKSEGSILKGTTQQTVGASELPGGRPGGLAGYFVISAADAREANAIARTCPHLKYGGSVIVRPIEDLRP